MSPATDGRLRGRILYILFLLVFTAACVEVGTRFYLGTVLQKASTNKFRFSPYRVYEHVPGFTEKDADGRPRLTINANGYRRTSDVSPRKPEGTYRIFLLGGSAAHGISSAKPYPIEHVRDEETIDAHLERLLKEAMPDRRVEVINAAVTGYQVFQHTQYLLSELLDMDPDLLIFFDGANDHYSNDPSHRYMLDFRYQFWTPRLQDPSLGSVWDLFAFWMAKHSALFRGYVAWKMNRDALAWNARVDLLTTEGSQEERTEAHRDLAPRQYLRHVETNLFLARRQGVKAIVCLQPMLVLRDTALLSDAEQRFLHQDENVRALYPVVLGELRTAAETYQVPVVDLNPAFNDPTHAGRQLLIDYCHLNSAGGEVVARTLLPVVMEQLRPAPVRVDSLPTAPAAPGI